MTKLADHYTSIQAQVDQACEDQAWIHVRWWNRRYEGTVNLVDEDGFRVGGERDGWPVDGGYCSWRGTVAIASEAHELPDDEAWKELWPEIEERRCACGCGESVEHLRSNARYATDACRTRHWKQRTGYADPRRGKPSRNATPKKRRPPELRVSYRKAIEALSEVVPELHELVAGEVEERAFWPVLERALQSCLTDRQRKVLANLNGSL